ncbi:MAG: hypothetical protein CVU02_02860 [Bacteroidetes bacterium HGW-Bacteroidetes-19]|nr:MAG: hypothetical protein CVU04_05505 [Bacteroidetes bacterium HGW-Bacteroidetes-20]PKP27705.1 MAG: hypothetical protein CVU02_02860 [Bacteroidetes bacterium HGW-Bacteroidetes-19]
MDKINLIQKYINPIIIFVGLIFFMLTSCQNVLEEASFELTGLHKPTPVISGFITPDSMVKIIMSGTLPAFSSDTAIYNYEQVTITDIKNNLIYNFYPSDSAQIWTHNNFTPEFGGLYKIQAQLSGSNDLIEAIDSIPYPCSVQNLTVLPAEGVYNLAKLKITPPTNTPKISYYEILVFGKTYSSTFGNGDGQIYNLKTYNELITSEDYYPNVNMTTPNYPKTLLFKTQPGQTPFYIDFVYMSPGGSGGGAIADYFLFEHTLRVEVRVVSQAYFLYKTSYYKQINAINGDSFYGLPNPVSVFSNIKHGLGVFAGFSTVSTEFLVPERYAND